MEGTRRHLDYIDTLRVIAAASVIYMHTAAAALYACVQETAPYVTRGWLLMNLLTSFAFTAVPLFFMISGYLLLSDEKTRDVSVLFRRRLPRLIVPLAFWTLLTAVWMGLTEGGGVMGVLALLRDALFGPIISPLWFMYILVLLYLLSPFLYAGLHGLTKGGHVLVLVMIALLSLRAALAALLPAEISAMLHLTSLKSLQMLDGNLLLVLPCLFLMLLGWYLGTWEKRLPKPLLIGVAAATWLVIVIGTYVRTRNHGYYDQAFQTQSAGFEVLLAACVFLLAKQGEDRPHRLLRAVPVAPLTLPMYLMHGLALQMFFCLYCPLHFLEVIGVTLLVFLGCYLASKTLASIKPLCYITTGMRFDAACSSCNWQWKAGKRKAKQKEADR